MNIDLTQDDIDRISMMIRREISETEKAKYNHEKVIEFFTKDLELLESIQKKLDE
jgi:hypothetical protein